MRLILEKAEIVAILGKHFEAALDPDKVIIRTEPFEIEVCGLPLGDAPEKPKEKENVVALSSRRNTVQEPQQEVEKVTAVKERDDANAITEPPPPDYDAVVGSGAADVHPAAVLAASKQLEQELERENPQLKRRAGRHSSTPPGDFKDEV